MTSSDCAPYLLSSTARRIWAGNDSKESARMYSCFRDLQRENFFRRVVYKNSRIPYERLLELADSVFVDCWIIFDQRGKSGNLSLTEPTYVGYLRKAFKGDFVKAVKKELRRMDEEKKAGEQSQSVTEIKLNENKMSPKVEYIFKQLSPDCRELLQWRHVDELTYDEIAERKDIKRDSAIKMVCRCGQRFIDLWNGLK